MSAQMPYTPDENEQTVLDALREEGRANPMLLREKTGLRKQYVNDALRQLRKADRVKKVSRGLYEYTGNEDTHTDAEMEAARDAWQAAYEAWKQADGEAVGDALERLGEVLDVKSEDDEASR